MCEYVQIINQGSFCRVLGRNHFGAYLLKNPHGRDQWFHKKAIRPAPHGQYIGCAVCGSPMLIDSGYFKSITPVALSRAQFAMRAFCELGPVAGTRISEYINANFCSHQCYLVKFPPLSERKKQYASQ